MHIRTVILGAGAAGLMAAGHCGPDTLVLDHAKAPGEKIRISGGGRCNFTNMGVEFKNFLGGNAHFHKSALSTYTQWDFIEMVSAYGIAWHEKTLGQLFSDDKATQIVAMLVSELEKAGAKLWLQTTIKEITHGPDGFRTRVERDGKALEITSDNLIVATGGKSIPKMGATGIAYDIAAQFGHAVTDTRAALVPFTFDKGRFSEISGVATPSRISNDRAGFDEALLFTHRGLSGPAVLQISSYWREGEEICVNLLPDTDLAGILKSKRTREGRKSLTTELGYHLPARLITFLAQEMDFKGNIADLSDRRIDELQSGLRNWRLKPTGTEGYRTAEVTLGGIDTDGFSSKTMMSKSLPGFYVIGEALDVTGWRGGYNFQWAWSSAMAAARAITA
jgi:predicted Rossmann fold flavoprotein